MTRLTLPPLSALRAFEAAARRASFKAAAEELLVTPTAISHQIRQLEAWLGCRVLDRSPRAVTLTSQGTILHEATTQGFGEIQRAVARLQERRPANILTLSSTSAFLSHWLMPRIERLRSALPQIDLRLHTSDRLEPLRPGGIEVAIRYGRAPFPGAVSSPLRNDEQVPVCSPALGIPSMSDLGTATLIHIDGRQRPSPAPDWQRWCALTGLTKIDATAGPRFPDSMLAVQAAIAGQGVTIVSRVLVADALAAGLLHAPFDQALEGDAYHFACAEGMEHEPNVKALQGWFIEALSLSS